MSAHATARPRDSLSFFFFKQKTAYEIGLGIPAEPLFRSKRLPRCKMRLKKRLLAFSRRLHARIRKTRYMHKMRCLLINRGVYCSRCVYYGKHQSFQATAGFRDYAPNAYSSSNGWSVLDRKSVV